MAAPGSRGAAPAPERVVVVGASAGGVEALVELVAALPADFPAAVLVVLHVSPIATSVLPEILTSAGPLLAVHPSDGEPLRGGVVYIAPRAVHLMVSDGRARLSAAPVENGVRPAVDPLFRSAARAYGPRAIGVVLSGMLEDGSAGLREVKRAGGIAIVQNPDCATFPAMPLSAIEHVAVDHVLTPGQIGAELAASVRRPAPAALAVASAPASGTIPDVRLGEMRTDIACPACGRILWEEARGPLLLYRCSAGHSFTVKTLLNAGEARLAKAGSAPARALRKRGATFERLAVRAEVSGREVAADRFHAQATSANDEAETLELEFTTREREQAAADHRRGRRA
jgi:two-component system, chemotaxis family, protein-glutamate methylesterase/glutaminase